MTALRRVPDVLGVRARNAPDHVAHDDTRHSLTFGQWHADADAIGGGLVGAGLEPGDRVL